MCSIWRCTRLAAFPRAAAPAAAPATAPATVPLTAPVTTEANGPAITEGATGTGQLAVDIGRLNSSNGTAFITQVLNPGRKEAGLGRLSYQVVAGAGGVYEGPEPYQQGGDQAPQPGHGDLRTDGPGLHLKVPAQAQRRRFFDRMCDGYNVCTVTGMWSQNNRNL